MKPDFEYADSIVLGLIVGLVIAYILALVLRAGLGAPVATTFWWSGGALGAAVAVGIGLPVCRELLWSRSIDGQNYRQLRRAEKLLEEIKRREEHNSRLAVVEAEIDRRLRLM